MGSLELRKHQHMLLHEQSMKMTWVWGWEAPTDRWPFIGYCLRSVLLTKQPLNSKYAYKIIPISTPSS